MGQDLRFTRHGGELSSLLVFPALVIFPGMIAIALYQAGDHFLPLVDAADPSKGVNYNMTIPMLLAGKDGVQIAVSLPSALQDASPPNGVSGADH